MSSKLFEHSDDGLPLGRTEPRIWTPPLVDELTPETSFGFHVIDFVARVLGLTLDPWEQWCLIHAGELLADGRPRFRRLLILVARQNGKTTLVKVLTLYWMFVEDVRLTLGTSTTLAYAKAAWLDVIAMAQANQWLSRQLGPKAVRATIGEEEFRTLRGATYRIAAANRRSGRSLTVHKLVLDELREHSTFDAWNAAYNAMNAVRYGQVVAISNQGDDSAVVLDSLRNPAITYIETGVGDPRRGLFEWSAPEDARPTDVYGLAQANPNVGRRLEWDTLLSAAADAEVAGGEELTGFKTEVMCIRVRQRDPAIEPGSWTECGCGARGIEPLNLADYRQYLAMSFDVSLDGTHAAALVAAKLPGSEDVHAEVVGSWEGIGCTAMLRRELPDLVRSIRPRVLAWFPKGPAAAVAAELGESRRRVWPPRRVELKEITVDLPAVCMGLADIVKSGELIHPDDEMLNRHVGSAQKLHRGEVWTFTRAGLYPVNGVYALAGAVHEARILPPPPPPLSVV